MTASMSRRTLQYPFAFFFVIYFAWFPVVVVVRGSLCVRCLLHSFFFPSFFCVLVVILGYLLYRTLRMHSSVVVSHVPAVISKRPDQQYESVAFYVLICLISTYYVMFEQSVTTRMGL